jgi:hypothetical protein
MHVRVGKGGLEVPVEHDLEGVGGGATAGNIENPALKIQNPNSKT